MNKPPVLSESRARELVEPHLDRFGHPILAAWADWQTIPIHMRKDLSASCRARFMYDRACTHSAKGFDEVPDVDLFQKDGILFHNLQEEAWVRYKKLDAGLRSHGYPTEQAVLFAQQAQLQPEQLRAPWAYPPATVLVAGYVLDPLGTEIRRLVITCSLNRQTLYEIDIPLAVALAQPKLKAEIQAASSTEGLKPPDVRSTREMEEEREAT